MAASVSVVLGEKSQNAFREYYRSLQQSENLTRDSHRQRLEKIDRMYMRELDRTKEQQDARTANARGDSDRIQNITVPVIKTQVETATDYQASVFLTGQRRWGCRVFRSPGRGRHSKLSSL